MSVNGGATSETRRFRHRSFGRGQIRGQNAEIQVAKSVATFPSWHLGNEHLRDILPSLGWPKRTEAPVYPIYRTSESPLPAYLSHISASSSPPSLSGFEKAGPLRHLDRPYLLVNVSKVSVDLQPIRYLGPQGRGGSCPVVALP